jgi:hypothetical protein
VAVEAGGICGSDLQAEARREAESQSAHCPCSPSVRRRPR